MASTISHPSLGQPLSNLRSPAFVINTRILTSNCQDMLKRCQERNIALRAGLKTHKTVECCRVQFGLSPEGKEEKGNVVQKSDWKVNVSTLAEAQFYLDAKENKGLPITDVNYHVCPTPDKLDEIWGLSGRVEIFSFLVDSEGLVEAVSSWAAKLGPEKEGQVKGKKLAVWIKVDTGAHRSGADDPLSLALAISKSPYLKLRGLYSFSGHSYSCKSAAEVSEVFYKERKQLRQLKTDIEKAGVVVGEMTVGCTPVAFAIESGEKTEWDDLEWEGITEVHPGMYLFRDVQSHQPPASKPTPETIAVYVHARILSVSKNLRQLRLDCGALALSKDTLRDGTFGRVVGHPDWKLVALSQEMAIVQGLCEADLRNPEIKSGKCVKVWMPHCCLSACCFREFHVVDVEPGDEEKWAEADPKVVDVWTPCFGW